ncbi:Glycosyltransferase involved in cell wall bisynthesis [Lutibacter agarilyticus]|uniref:Glycosyltransferase involved in cell wall bisynthesis n=1 Tax=Lutibacter agarilyticus TaxID=1109740 RepID=A0A238YYZ4_9FLAO|nr:glycosyltransferase [Lutibacter agarilyticus]SNR75749.1 Glycosyltransferase involved in cell wall bisynthesis [Lutibacter agarilyticus]
MKQHLKIIQLIDSLTPGGAEMMAVNIANALAEEGMQSHICATRLEGDLKLKIAANVGYLFLNKKRTIDFKAIRQLRIYIKQHQITIIHAHSSSYFLGFIMKLLNPKLRLIWHDHFGMSEALDPRPKFPLVWISRFFNATISVNTLLLEWNQHYLKVAKNVYLQNFANFNPQEIKQTELKGDEGKRIVCLANLRPQKDHLNLLKAFCIVQKVRSDWTLHLVGMDFLDAYSEKIKAYIKEHGLVNHVFLYGSCSDTSNVLAQATIGVLASSSEGLPVALLEYGLMQLPVVTTNVGECGKVIFNEQNGLVVIKENEFVVAEALEVLIKDESKRNIFGTELYEHIKVHYSKEAYTQQLIGIYCDAN